MYSYQSLVRLARRGAGGAFVAAMVAATIPAGAQTEAPALNPDRPEVYTVKKGDTLWDISGRFLERPWLWPQIWEVNPQIKNPDLIYPGDEVALSFSGGKPVLRVRRGGGGRPTVKLSPRVRVEQRDFQAIPTIPIDAISQFLSRPRIVGESELDGAPYIVSVGKEHLVAGSGYRVFARGFDQSDIRRYTVFRRGATYFDPDSAYKKILGYEAVHVADAVVEAPGDPATLRLTASSREVLIGDRLLPVDDSATAQDFLPRPPDRPITGRIIQVVDGVTQIGQYQVVVLNVGRDRGVAPGYVMDVYQAGATVPDPLRRKPPREAPPPIDLPPGDAPMGPNEVFQSILRFGLEMRTVVVPDLATAILPKGWTGDEAVVTLPDEKAGTIMVFRAFDEISYALVMKASRPMHVLDRVTNP